MTTSCGASRFSETQDGTDGRNDAGVIAKKIVALSTIELGRRRSAFIPGVNGHLSQEFAPWFLRVASIDGGFQNALAPQGVGDQAEFLCAFEKFLGFLLIDRGFDREYGARDVSRELCDAGGPLKDSLDMRLEALPLQVRRTRHTAKCKDEAIRNRGNEQRLRRPNSARSIKLRRRGGLQVRQVGGADQNGPGS